MEKYKCPSETSSEASEHPISPVDTPVALSRSKAQPHLLRTVLATGTPCINQQTPQSARTLRIESPWDTKSKLPQAEDHPWWYPEIWGPAKDLPTELASFLRHLPPADVFHNHRIYILYDEFEKPIEKYVTVLIVMPSGTGARVVSGELYDEGARLVTRRHLERTRYEELSREERKKMARGEQCCIFYPCRVACCPLLHNEGQHQPMAPEELADKNPASYVVVSGEAVRQFTLASKTEVFCCVHRANETNAVESDDGERGESRI
ncbi:uncharacterized protein ColSpa_04435 [Colletotrichum spaethianum]|uniref:Uncharacterized protein n=1 Tax=Colletotrichum spaethianum TaxID=700344 RepID=A0AA37P7J6_9PEZI|nr:uncharacterized protein ColSpa_04435 [Colletotrichum spaethianum]GKT44254.1 hypothetical protein ColSpa_04435 [Colletotrichum spaethianum]